jgi:hypothetical protein
MEHILSIFDGAVIFVMPKFVHSVRPMVPERVCKQATIHFELGGSTDFIIFEAVHHRHLLGWITNHFVGTKLINQINVRAACG